jgi:hypothetical protein
MISITTSRHFEAKGVLLLLPLQWDRDLKLWTCGFRRHRRIFICFAENRTTSAKLIKSETCDREDKKIQQPLKRDVRPWSLIDVYQCFAASWCLHLQGWRLNRMGGKGILKTEDTLSWILFPFHFSHIWFTLHWRWRQHFNSKRCYLPTKLHGVTCQMIVNLYIHLYENHKSHSHSYFMLHFGITFTFSLLGLWLLQRVCTLVLNDVEELQIQHGR